MFFFIYKDTKNIFSYHSDKKRQVYRSCQLHGGGTDPCSIYQQKAESKKTIKIESCNICEEDFCNSARKNFILIGSMSTMFTGLAASIIFSRTIIV